MGRLFSQRFATSARTASFLYLIGLSHHGNKAPRNLEEATVFPKQSESLHEEAHEWTAITQ